MKSPLITMSAITGNPSRDEIYSYMLSLKENGIEQAMLYPRSGCEIEYLSERWFECIGDFIKSAKMLDMCIWLYDDFNWPSGDAGGKVTAIPEFRLQAISTKGDNAGQINVKSRHNAGLFGEKFFPNLLSGEAVEYFIKCTHEEYYKRFGDSFGTVIKGIFTDEPSIGYCCYEDYIPYYDGIRGDYFELFGRDFDIDMRSEYKHFYKNAITVISNRFKTSYIDKIASWCSSHGLLMTGHFMCDHNPIHSVRHNGNTLKNLSALSLPGIDEIYTSFDDVCEMALFGLAESVSGKNGAMAELFALGPCDMSYAKKRAMLYFCACHKIDHYFLAISHFDMRGNALVKDYFNTFSADQPDFSAVKELAYEATYASKIAKKDFVPDVYIRFPFDASASKIADNVDTIPFLSVINELTEKQIQWKFIGSEAPQAPVIELSEDFELTLDGRALDLSKIQGKLTVTDTSGNATKGIFVRRFDDESFIVLNLFAPDGEYLVDGKSVRLNRYDVYFSGSKECTRNEKTLKPVFKVSYKNSNTVRTMHLCSNSASEIKCELDTEVIFAVRNGSQAYLNGEKLLCEESADALSVGMRSLYKCSKPITLKKGTSEIVASNDLKYLPSVLIIGNFLCESVSADTCAVILKKRVDSYACTDELYHYGSVEFSADVDIPNNAEKIEICGTDLLTEVYINDTPLGKKAFSPYIFDIPSNISGTKVALKIVQYSSIAPIFADVDFWDKNVKECAWRGTPSTTKRSFGFSHISFKD